MEKSFYFKDQKISYYDEGYGYTLVVIHGWLNQGFNYELANLLTSRGYRVILLNFFSLEKNQGLQKTWLRDDIIECILKLISHLKIKKFSLLGHSWGTTVAIKLAAKYPQEIGALFLCAPDILAGGGLRDKIKWVAGFKISFRIFFLFYTAFVFILGKKNLYNLFKKTKGTSLERLRLMIIDDVSPCLKEIKTPTLVFWGDKDKMVDLKNTKFVAENIPGATFQVVQGATHTIEGKFAMIIVNSITKFLNKIKSK